MECDTETPRLKTIRFERASDRTETLRLADVVFALDKCTGRWKVVYGKLALAKRREDVDLNAVEFSIDFSTRLLDVMAEVRGLKPREAANDNTSVVDETMDDMCRLSDPRTILIHSWELGFYVLED